MSTEATVMSEAMYYVMLALLNPNHGYQLMAAIEEASHGRIKMGPGTLYGILTRMLGEELIVIINDDGRRKTYGLTSKGRNVLKLEYARLKSMIDEGSIIDTL